MLKHALQHTIRAFHVAGFDRGLPPKVGLYFHTLEPPDYAAFRAAVACFRAHGYRFATGPLDFLAAPDPVAWISFDDNYRAWHRALPLLDELDVRATFYVNTAFFRDRATPAALADYFRRIEHMGEPVTLSTAELRALRAAGHVVGAHTHTHPRLTALPEAEAQAEIRRSKEELEDLIGEPVRHFSYPFGMRRHFSEALRAYGRAIGFETVANAIPGLQHAGQQPLALQRQVWRPERPLAENLQHVRTDGRLFERLTGRSAVG